MLATEPAVTKPSNDLIRKSLIDDPFANSLALGCWSCPHFEDCGGLSVRAPLFDCLDLCCGGESGCSSVCRNHPDFIDQFREAGGFSLCNVPRTNRISFDAEEGIVPLIYHGSSREQPIDANVVALRLADIIDFQRGILRFASRRALREAFKVSANSKIILCGIDHDHRIEPWWALGESRSSIISSLKGLGVSLVTTPNFSVILDRPRMDSLHAIKRIAEVFAEFQANGMAAALHINGSTLADFSRWKEFIRERSEISAVAYEFITGPGRKDRRDFHLDRLAEISESAGRPLTVYLRGDPRVIPFLRRFYARVVYIDTTSFLKSIKRQKAFRADNSTLTWLQHPTASGECVDDLFAHNFEEQREWINSSFFVAENSS